MIGNIKSKNIICSNVHYFYYGIDRFLKSMQENEWGATELYLGTPHIFVDGNIVDDFNCVADLARRHKVKITDVHPETISFRYTLCSLDSTWNQASLQAYRNTISYAACIGAESVNTNLTGAFRDLDQRKIFNSVAKNLIELADYARLKGVLLTLETESPEYEGFICSLQQMQRLAALINGSNLRIGINVGAIKDAGETLKDWEQAFGGKIRYLRFSSIEEFQDTWSEICGTALSDKRMLFFLNDDAYLEEPSGYDRILKEAIYGID